MIEDLNDSRIELVYYPLDHRCVKDDHAKSLLTSEEDLELTTPDYLEPFPQGRKRSKRQQQDYETLTKNGVVFDKGGATRQIQKFVLPQHNVSEDDLILLLGGTGARGAPISKLYTCPTLDRSKTRRAVLLKRAVCNTCLRAFETRVSLQ